MPRIQLMIASRSRDPWYFAEVGFTGASPLGSLSAGGCLNLPRMSSLEVWEPPFFMFSTGEFEPTVGEVCVDEAVVSWWAVTESPPVGRDIDFPEGIAIERDRGALPRLPPCFVAPSPLAAILFTAVGAACIEKIYSKGSNSLNQP